MRSSRHECPRSIAISALLLFGACGNETSRLAADAAAIDAVVPDAAELLPELTNLALSSTSPLVPAFAPSQLTYQLNVLFEEIELTVTPTALDPNATILVNSIPVTSESPSQPITLDLGLNVVTVQVTASSGLSQAYVLEVTRGAAVIEQVAYGKASNTAAADHFGLSVALSGDILAVGSPGEDSNATGIDGNQANNDESSSGAVYIFRRTGTIWAQEAYLKSSNTEGGDGFGTTVAISGDTVAVGAIGEDSNATGVDGNQADNSLLGAGAVYVFRRTGTTWAQEAYIKASTAGANDVFGGSLSLSNDTLIVGARREGSNATGMNGDEANNSALSSGAVFVFHRTGTTWAQEAYVKASNTEANDGFGCAVAFSGDTLAVGAQGEDGGSIGVNGDQQDNSAVNSGAVYVFRRIGTNWEQQAYLKASNTEGDDFFGRSLALSGETLAIAAPPEDSKATGIDGDQADNSETVSGAVYVFQRTDTTWEQQAYVKASNTEARDAFGTSLALSGDRLAIGAYEEDSNATGSNGDQADNSSLSSGAAYLFHRTGAHWEQAAYLKASNPSMQAFFGNSVALNADTVVVSAPFENSDATGIDGDQANNLADASGAVYLFQ